jgi:uncharacterized protein
MPDTLNRFARAAKAAVKAVAAYKQIHTYQLQGKVVTCPHCQNDQFDEGSALLNTAGMTFIHLDWANRSATILACKRCGQIQWFLQQPEKVSSESTLPETK